METRTYNVYPWAELPEEARVKALDKYQEINTDHDWWTLDDFITEDACNRFGIKVSMDDIVFDLYSRYCYFTKIEILPKFWKNLYFTEETIGKIDYEISTAHYLRSLNPFLSVLIDGEEEEDYSKQANDQLQDFFKEALRILQSDYDYLTSEEGIIGTFEANDYLFTLEGEID